MTTYNLALVLDENAEKEIMDFAKIVNNKLNTEFVFDKNAKPHISIVKFKSDRSLEKIRIIKNKFKEIKIEFAGLTLLPSNNGGTWVEISVLSCKKIKEMVKELAILLKNENIINSLGDRFRPHLTISKLKNQENINILKLDYNILRKKINAHLDIIVYS